MDAGDINLAGGVLAGVALLVSRVNHRYAREQAAAAERLRHERQLSEDKQQKNFFTSPRSWSSTLNVSLSTVQELPRMPVMKIVTVLPGFQWYRKTSIASAISRLAESCPAILCTVSARCPYCRTVLTGLSVQQLNMMIH
jgi:hypothetical protein